MLQCICMCMWFACPGTCLECVWHERGLVLGLGLQFQWPTSPQQGWIGSASLTVNTTQELDMKQAAKPTIPIVTAGLGCLAAWLLVSCPLLYYHAILSCHPPTPCMAWMHTRARARPCLLIHTVAKNQHVVSINMNQTPSTRTRWQRQVRGERQQPQQHVTCCCA